MYLILAEKSYILHRDFPYYINGDDEIIKRNPVALALGLYTRGLFSHCSR